MHDIVPVQVNRCMRISNVFVLGTKCVQLYDWDSRKVPKNEEVELVRSCDARKVRYYVGKFCPINEAPVLIRCEGGC